MINDIDLDPNIEYAYELDNLDMSNCLLIKSTESMHIETPGAIFPFKSIKDFNIDQDCVYLINEDKDILKLKQYQFQIISELLMEF